MLPQTTMWTGCIVLVYEATVRRSGDGLEREEAAHVLPQQLREALVQVGADRDIALVAVLVLVNSSIMRPRSSSGYRLNCIEQGCSMPCGGHHQESQPGLAAGRAAVLEVAARGFERGRRVDDPVGASRRASTRSSSRLSVASCSGVLRK